MNSRWGGDVGGQYSLCDVINHSEWLQSQFHMNIEYFMAIPHTTSCGTYKYHKIEL